MNFNVKATIKNFSTAAPKSIVASTYTNILKLFDTTPFVIKTIPQGKS